MRLWHQPSQPQSAALPLACEAASKTLRPAQRRVFPAAMDSSQRNESYGEAYMSAAQQYMVEGSDREDEAHNDEAAEMVRTPSPGEASQC